MSSPTSGSQAPLRAVISQVEADAVRAAWAQNSNDVGLGLYNPFRGAIHVGTYDTTGQQMGHDGLQMTVGIPDVERLQWRGFVFTSSGQLINVSGFNIPDGAAPRMRADYLVQVDDALRRASLL
jgi:hypothetical protein